MSDFLTNARERREAGWLSEEDLIELLGARPESTLTTAERRTLRRWCGHDEELKASLAAARRIVDAMADDFSDRTAHLDHWIEVLRDLCWAYAHRGEVAVWPREEGKPFTASRNHAWNEDS